MRPLPTRARPTGRAIVFVTLIATACGGGGSGTDPRAPAATALVLSTSLPALDAAREGRYEAWAVEPSGTRRSLGRFDGGSFTTAVPATTPVAIEVTVERPGDTDAIPSEQVVLRGDWTNGRADLSYIGAVTVTGQVMKDKPGQFTMFTPSDNELYGYPSHEESGVWLFNMEPATTAQKDYYVRVTQLQRGWTYEGWMVRDLDTPNAIWLSYGKFLPDWTGALNSPDDTGWGPFSGVPDFRTQQLEDFPGDDWISNPLGLPFPSALTLPLDLREKDAAGNLRWSHVITIEPATDRGEPLTTEKPFFIHPYVDSFGDKGPGIARVLTLRTSTLPTGTAELR
ncbi:MAG TPA: anti-sigma factor [Gemmatimonadaceae bacterium]